MNILITGIGGPTPRSIAKAIRKKNSADRIIGVDSNNRALGFYIQGLVDRSIVIPRISEPEYWDFIYQILDEENIDLAFVQPELEVIGWGRKFQKDRAFPCPVLIPPVELAISLMDKAVMSEVLNGTEFIPKTLRISHDEPKFDLVKQEVGFPCWIRATQGSGGLGSLKITDMEGLRSWLFINKDIPEFTISEFLPGRHLANQMLYWEGEYIKGASLECVEYVMASIAPSKVTGNTSYGRFINEDNLLSFCNESLIYICEKLGIEPHGVFSYDLKEDVNGNPKITEINIRHMAYTGIMASVGFDLIQDSIELLTKGSKKIAKEPYFQFRKPYAFLRDVDIEPIILDDRKLPN